MGDCINAHLLRTELRGILRCLDVPNLGPELDQACRMQLIDLAARLSGMAADWVHVDAVEPQHDTRNESFGTEYLVHPSQPGERTAFYGRRLGGKAQWYRHGAPVSGVTHYRTIPAAPEPPHA